VYQVAGRVVLIARIVWCTKLREMQLLYWLADITIKFLAGNRAPALGADVVRVFFKINTLKINGYDSKIVTLLL